MSEANYSIVHFNILPSLYLQKLWTQVLDEFIGELMNKFASMSVAIVLLCKCLLELVVYGNWIGIAGREDGEFLRLLAEVWVRGLGVGFGCGKSIINARSDVRYGTLISSRHHKSMSALAQQGWQ